MMRSLPLALLLALVTAPALAHHPMGGETPQTLLHGLLSGVGHPIIGIDHLAFIVAAGVLAGLAGRPLLAPLGLVAGALAGAALHLGAVNVPGAEALVATSVLAAGVAVYLGRAAGAGLLAVGFATAGLFHGFAYAESIVGAEQGVVAAYLVSFSVTQWAIAATAGLAARSMAGERAWERMRRIAGVAFSAVGLTFLVQAAI